MLRAMYTAQHIICWLFSDLCRQGDERKKKSEGEKNAIRICIML